MTVASWPAAEGAVEVGHTPQLFIDDALVDNRWGVKYRTEAVTRVFHAPAKHEGNPVIAGHGGYVNAVRDEEAGLYRMWYQEYWDQSLEPRKYTYGVAYAESSDGVDWCLPRIGRHAFKGTTDNNIVLLGRSAPRISCCRISSTGAEVRLEFEMKGAVDLYGFQFAPEGP